MKVSDLTNNYNVRLTVSRQEDPERELRPGDEVLIETLRDGTKRYAKITGNTPKSWWKKEVKPPVRQNNSSIF